MVHALTLILSLFFGFPRAINQSYLCWQEQGTHYTINSKPTYPSSESKSPPSGFANKTSCGSVETSNSGSPATEKVKIYIKGSFFERTARVNFRQLSRISGSARIQVSIFPATHPPSLPFFTILKIGREQDGGRVDLFLAQLIVSGSAIAAC